jgi:hypothetical protein
MAATETKSECDTQAEEFLNKTGTKMTVEFVMHGRHFEDDKEDRDIYKVTLIRGSRKMTIMFGQSLKCSGKYRIVDSIVRAKEGITCFNSDEQLKKLKAKYKAAYGQFWQENEKFEGPSAYAILCGLSKDDPESFEDFCRNFGYDTDSRKAEKIYKVVQKEFNDLCTLFNEEEMDMLREVA